MKNGFNKNGNSTTIRGYGWMRGGGRERERERERMGICRMTSLLRGFIALAAVSSLFGIQSPKFNFVVVVVWQWWRAQEQWMERWDGGCQRGYVQRTCSCSTVFMLCPMYPMCTPARFNLTHFYQREDSRRYNMATAVEPATAKHGTYQRYKYIGGKEGWKTM